MPVSGPLIEIAKLHTKAGSDGGKILVITSAAKTFTDVPEGETNDEEKAAEVKQTLKSKIQCLDAVLFLMYDKTIPADDSGIIVRLHPGVDPDLAAKVIAETINAHHGWVPGDPVISPEETFWRGSPMH